MVGHDFLKSLGRTKLRPGGGVGTKWLFDSISWTSEMKVLEIACNQGSNLIELYNNYGIDITGIDIDDKVINEATENVKLLNLEDKIHIKKMSALDLDFEDNSLDLIINEAMLTMYKNEKKSEALKEYYRVLKKGGKILTHDVFLYKDDNELRESLSKNIKMSVYPQTIEKWKYLFDKVGFKNLQIKTGPMVLLDIPTLIKDEGAMGAVRIIKNGMKKENRDTFIGMKGFNNKHSGKIGYILISSEK